MTLLLALLLAQGDPAQPLIEKLSSDRIEVREEACRKLEELGTQAVPALLRAAALPDEEVAARARELLQRIPLREAATPNLIRAVPGVIDRLVKGEPAEIFLEIAADLRLRGEQRQYPALQPLDLERLAPLALRGAGTPGRRARVCEEIVRLGIRTAFREAVDLLATGDETSRAAAGRLLQRLEAKEAVAEISALSGNESPDVRLAVASILGAAKAREALPTLRRLLADSQWGVRAAAAGALRDIGAREAAPELRPLLQDESRLVRSVAAHAIGRLGDRGATADLVRLLGDPSSDVRWWTVRALAELDARDAAKAVAALLEDPAPEVRRVAAETVAALRPPK